MEENSNSVAVEIMKNNNSSEDHGWKKVSYHKKSKTQPQNQQNARSMSAAAAHGVSSDRRNDVFRMIELHSEERHKKWLEDQRAAAVATGDYAAGVVIDEDSDGEEAAAPVNGGGEEKKSKEKLPTKPEKEKRPKEPTPTPPERPTPERPPERARVTVAEAASKIDSSDLADISVSYEAQQDIQLMRFADYFGRAVAQVSGSQFPWMKMLKESSVAKMVDVSSFVFLFTAMFG